MDGIYLIYFLLGILLCFGAKLCPRGEWNEEYTSLDQTKILQGITALGIAIYGMFIAIVVPPAREDRHVLFCVALAVVLSCLFRFLPALSGVQTGFVIILCSVLAAAVTAALFPLEEKEGSHGL